MRVSKDTTCQSRIDRKTRTYRQVARSPTHGPWRNSHVNPKQKRTTQKVPSNVTQWVEKSMAGDTQAFTALMQQYQNLALGYAFSKLGDFQLAQDVVQDSFVIAYHKLDSLEKPDSFPSWIRGIVHHRCHRMFRTQAQNQRLHSAKSQDEMTDFPTHETAPESELNLAQQKALLLEAVRKLPEKQREIVTLFYLEEQSQAEVANFLGIPVSSVNNHLYKARQTIKRRLTTMAQETFYEQRLNEEFAKNVGDILNIQGALVETRPTVEDGWGLLDVVGTKTHQQEQGSDLMVIQRNSNGTFRCLALGESVPKGGNITPQSQTGERLRELDDSKIRSALAHLKSQKSTPAVLETGIKVLDLFCPLQEGGSVGIFGKEGVGRMVFLQELIHRLKPTGDALQVVFFVNHWNLLGTQDMIESEPMLRNDKHGCLETAWLQHPRASDPMYSQDADYLDASLYFNPLLAADQLWPALDPLHSFSKALTHEVVGERHVQIATAAKRLLNQAREWMRDPKYLELLAMDAREAASQQRIIFLQERMKQLSEQQRVLVHRARCLERYLTQPFYVAEDFTKFIGSSVSREQTLLDVEAILGGKIDKRNPDELRWQGSLA